MDNILAQLEVIANELDQKGYIVLADTVDAVMKTASSVKTAQYVGIQGYWIRNSRCWGNCYRQKRSSNPTMASQEVWAECHDEYAKSVTDKEARKSWDKYAADNMGLLKSASVQNEADAHFNRLINEHISSGKDIPQAVLSAVATVKQDSFVKMIHASADLLKVADVISESDFNMSVRLSEAAHELSKEAQWYNPADWAAKGVRGLGNAQRGIGDWAQNRGEQSAQRDLERAQKRNQQMQERRNTRPWMNPNGAPQPGVGQPGPASGVPVVPPAAGGAPAGAGPAGAAPPPPGGPAAAHAAGGPAGAAGLGKPKLSPAQMKEAEKIYTQIAQLKHQVVGIVGDEAMVDSGISQAYAKAKNINPLAAGASPSAPAAPGSAPAAPKPAAPAQPGINGPGHTPPNASWAGPKPKINQNGGFQNQPSVTGPGL